MLRPAPYVPWVEFDGPEVQVRPFVRQRTLGDLDPFAPAGVSKAMLGVHSLILMAVAYHGYKRNAMSFAWGGLWALSGLMCPTVTLVWAVSQGFAQPAKGAA